MATLGFARRRARQAALSVRRAVDGVFLMLVCCLIFGHALDVILYRAGELAADWQLILPWRGGACSLGALVGLVVAAGIAFRAPQGGLDWRYLDQVVLGLLLGLGILRVGCFLGHHHAGRLSQCVLAVAYPGGARHDLGLEEALLVFCLLAGLVILERKLQPEQAGFLSASSMLGYGMVRFALEGLRGDDIELLGRHSDPRYVGLTALQYGALLLAALGVLLLLSRMRRLRDGLRRADDSSGRRFEPR
jgi:phosphatidylglycerol:prolipoprotein diacylglycerol transferase